MSTSATSLVEMGPSSRWHQRRDLALIIGLCAGCLAFFFSEAASEARILRDVTFTSMATGSPVTIPNTYGYRLARSIGHATRIFPFGSIFVVLLCAGIALSWRRHRERADSHLIGVSIRGAAIGFAISIVTWLVFGGWGPAGLFGLSLGCAFGALATATMVDHTTFRAKLVVASLLAVFPAAWLLLAI